MERTHLDVGAGRVQLVELLPRTTSPGSTAGVLAGVATGRLDGVAPADATATVGSASAATRPIAVRRGLRTWCSFPPGEAGIVAEIHRHPVVGRARNGPEDHGGCRVPSTSWP